MTPVSIGRPRFVTIEETLAWHEIAISRYGGSTGLRDRALLESALAQPKQGFGGQYSNQFPFEMAAAYAYFVAKNHPFVDGNKRVALMCCGGFLRMNGWNLESTGTEAADAVIALVENRMDRAQFAEWLVTKCLQRVSLELRDFFALIDFDKLHQYIAALNADQSSLATQFIAGSEEAAQAIPVASHLLNIMHKAALAQNAQALASAQRDLLFFVMLYRIAEDMGYEW